MAAHAGHSQTLIDLGSDLFAVPTLLVDVDGTPIASVPVGALTAGETHIGDVGSPVVYVTSTPTLSVAASYATGDYVGPSTTPASFAGVARAAGEPSTIKSLTIVDKTVTGAVAMELWLFSETFTAPLDSAAWTVSDAHALLCVGVIPIPTTGWYASAANKVYTANNIDLVVVCAAVDLFYAIVVRGTPPAWADGDLQLSLGVLQS